VLDQKATIEQFLAATAARQPTPGGGGVTALVGALSAAMAEMVVNYSLGKPDLAQYEDELQEILVKLTRARQMLLQFMAEDQTAYEALSAARKLPEGTGKSQAFSLALGACIAAPESVAATSMAVLELCGRLIPIANKYLLSDLDVAANLATSTVRCAVQNARANLPEITDPKEREKIEQFSKHVLGRAVMYVQHVSPNIRKRAGEK
jgi:formiminotetrahydrofolate cyclodeaminase